MFCWLRVKEFTGLHSSREAEGHPVAPLPDALAEVLEAHIRHRDPGLFSHLPHDAINCRFPDLKGTAGPGPAAGVGPGRRTPLKEQHFPLVVEHQRTATHANEVLARDRHREFRRLVET